MAVRCIISASSVILNWCGFVFFRSKRRILNFRCLLRTAKSSTWKIFWRQENLVRFIVLFLLIAFIKMKGRLTCCAVLPTFLCSCFTSIFLLQNLHNWRENYSGIFEYDFQWISMPFHHIFSVNVYNFKHICWFRYAKSLHCSHWFNLAGNT